MDSAVHGRLIVSVARRWLGTPYRHQTSLMGVGCDCLGLIRGVWREVVGKEPEVPGPYSSHWSEVEPSERLLNAAERHFMPVDALDAEIGDVLVFRMRRRAIAKHMVIKSEDQGMIHAYDGHSVVETHLSTSWKYRIAGVFRFPGKRGT